MHDLKDHEHERFGAVLTNSTPKPTVRVMTLCVDSVVDVLLAALVEPATVCATDLANIDHSGHDIPNRVDATGRHWCIRIHCESVGADHNCDCPI